MRYGFAALIIVCVLFAIPASSIAVELGDEAPALVGVDLDGNEVSLAALNAGGKFVFIDFWAKWCAPCIRELPNVAPFYDEFASDRFEMIGVSLDTEDTYEEMLGVIADEGLHYPIIYEGGGWQTRLAVEWDIHSIPATFLINPDGIIVLKDVRGEDGLQLVRKLVEDVPDFLPPPVEVQSALAADGSEAVIDVTINDLEARKYNFQFSYYYRYEDDAGEVQEAEDLFGLFITPKMGADGEWEFDLSAVPMMWDEMKQRALLDLVSSKDTATLTVHIPVGHEVGWVFLAVTYIPPELGGPIALHHAYARPPAEEPAE